MFWKKKQPVTSAISYDEITNTYSYNGSSINVEECMDGSFRVAIDNNAMKLSANEFIMLYMYFGLLYKKMSE